MGASFFLEGFNRLLDYVPLQGDSRNEHLHIDFVIRMRECELVEQMVAVGLVTGEPVVSLVVVEAPVSVFLELGKDARVLAVDKDIVRGGQFHKFIQKPVAEGFALQVSKVLVGHPLARLCLYGDLYCGFH